MNRACDPHESARTAAAGKVAPLLEGNADENTTATVQSLCATGKLTVCELEHGYLVR